MFRICRYLLIYAVLLLTACSAMQDRSGLAKSLAQRGDLQKQKINTSEFTLITFYKWANLNSNLLVIYIEGDGYAWKRKQYLSSDPTPRDPLALKLAAQDPNPAVLYIARPCQYLSAKDLKACAVKYWSSHRYAEEVVASINEVIDWGVSQSGADSVALYGYSGGGSIAVLVAARRDDVARLTTVAANLDHVKWTEIHGITPLSGSLNAADYATKIEHISQLHLIGAKDKLVPASITETYKAKANNPEKIKIKIISDFDHRCCWAEFWPTLLSQIEIPEE